MIKLLSCCVLFVAMLSAAVPAQTVTVNSTDALVAAYGELSATPGGGTIALAADLPPETELRLSGGGSNPVHITSADPFAPVQVSRIAIDQAQSIRISHLRVNGDAVDRPDWHRDLDVTNSSRIEIDDVAFSSDADSFFNPSDPNSSNGGEMGLIRWSEDITVSDSHVAGYLHGLQVFESTVITVRGSEFQGIVGDGIRLAGVQDVLIQDNHMHDFFATTNEYTHSDFIQMWSTNAEIESRNITVTGNVLDAGSGNSSQGIWMRNEQYDTGVDRNYIYENITITDNLIYTGNPNGIGIGTADGVVIENNTLLWNPEGTTLINGVERSWPPSIRLADNLSNAEVHDNIAYEVARWDLNGAPRGDVNTSGNILVSYTPGDPNYIGNHFPAAANGGDVGIEGLQLRPDSPWVGTGADLEASRR